MTETFRDAFDEWMFNNALTAEESDRLFKLVLAHLERVEQADELSVMLDYGVVYAMPLEIAVPAFEKLLRLTSSAPEVLREFAFKLVMSGPDFDERAAELRALADATDRANGVEPPKYIRMTPDGPLEEDD